VGLLRDLDKPKREILPQNLGYFPLDCSFPTNVAQVLVSLAGLSLREIDVPHREVAVTSPVEQRPTNVFAEYATVVRAGLI
jgi:hypothetical protein